MTVLFQDDWTSKAGKLKAIPHLTTKNTSFLRTCALLRKLSISNYAFPLCLYDPDLKHVDVHDLEDDTPENEILRTKVIIEARRNVWYFLRECVRVPAQGGGAVQYRLDRSNLAMTWCFMNGIDYCGMAPRQCGKASKLDSLIKVPGGWKTMGEMEIGTEIVAPDGTITEVVGVYPQGEKDIYRVTFEDGRWTECCDEHLWKVHWPHWGESDGGSWRVISLREIMDFMDSHRKSNNRLTIPLVEPEIKDDVDLPIDPYVLGVILGDGCITNKNVVVCKPDQFIKDEIDRLLFPNYQTSPWHSNGKSYSIISMNNKPSLRLILQDMGLWGKLHDNKFIPDIYMESSASQKWSLIQGLMDTDGSASKKTFCSDGVTVKSGSSEFSTTSLVLAQQYQELIRSLGGLCKISQRQTKYTYLGEKLTGKVSYRLIPRVKDKSLLFRTPVKRELVLGEYKYQESLKLAIRSIEYVGKHPAQCIEVAHPDHLYVTDHHIVTHNTIGAVCLIGWIMYSSGESFSIGHYCKDNALREQNVKRVRDVAELLPFWWIAEDKFRDKKNTQELYYHALGTHFQTTVAQADDRKADNNARGLTQPVQWIDEAEFCVNIGISYPTMLGATTAARESARLNGKPYSNIITTTAGDPANDACKEAAAILDGAMAFTEHLYDLPNKDKLHEVVEASSSQKMVLGVFSHLQLGRDNKWLRDIINRLKSTREQVMRDFLNRRVTIQDEPIIPKHILAQITASEREPDHIQIMSSKFVIRWYIPKEEVNSQAFRDRPIVVGCDSSEMIGKDATTLVGVDPRDFSVVFTFRCNEGNINIVGAMIAQLLLMFPKFLWVPENKSSGTSLIDIVTLLLRKEGHNPFMRIFNWIVDRKHEAEFAKFNIRDTSLLDTSAKRYFGIKTDKSKRDELYGATLLTAAEKACNRIRDKNLISELSSLTVRNGRVDHEVGGNDDTVIAFLMSMFAILNGRHLDVYGIKPGTIMSYVAPGQPDKNKITQEQQKIIHSKIEELENKLKFQKDPTLKLLLEKDIDVMKSMIKHTQTLLPETADEFIRDPRKFTDPTIAEASRIPIEATDMERSLRSIMGLSS